MEGTTIQLFKSKGYGFVSDPNGDGGIFFHAIENQSIFDELELFDEVMFEIFQGEQGPRAAITKVEGKAKHNGKRKARR